MILSLENVSLKYVIDPVLDGVDFVINEKDKWGVVGPNGSGKSTLLRILAEVEKPDSGKVTVLRKYRISYCPQTMDFKPGLSVYETVKSAMKEETEIFQIRSILNRLGITDHDEMIEVLSGGQKKRVALAIALIREADLYLLDEPTNHLDQDMIIWLEKFLSKMNKALVLVTHDRYFLSRITDHIAEIDNAKLYLYEGNYADYLEKRELRYQMALLEHQKRQNFLRKEVEWIRRGAQARSTKSKDRIARFEELSAIRGPKEKETLELRSASSYLGKKTIELNNVSKSFDDKVLFRDFSYNLLRNDRIGIIGDNGSGKSTLIRIILGELKPDSGTVSRGETVKIGYFAQTNITMNPEMRVIDYLKEHGEIVYTADGEAITASQMLERFLFDRDSQYRPIGKCSGGELRRLYLCSILMDAPNILLLDEPTNDLDTDTLGILEDYLDGFKGAVISVSHDRYFLDKTCDRLFVFENGNISIVEDDYSSYLENREKSKSTVNAAVRSDVRIQENHRAPKMSYREKMEFEALEKELPLLEEEIGRLEAEMNEISDYEKIAAISKKLDELNGDLETKTERYLELSEKA